MEEKTVLKKLAPWRRAIGIILFLGILFGLIVLVSQPLINPGDARSYRNVVGFYELKEDTCDVVCIGSSRTYAFWTPLYAYDRHGIRMFNFATPGQPIEAARYVVEEALKTQPHAAFVINLDDVKVNKSERFHQILDHFRFSGTKLGMIRAFMSKTDTPYIDRLEYVFPIIRYHSRWKELTENDFWKNTDGLMGSSNYPTWLYGTEDESENVFEEGESVELNDYTRGVIRELVEYCDQRGVRLLLTMSPQTDIIPSTLALRAAMREYAESLGATVLDMQFKMDEIGIDPARDYYNAAHTNIHGSFKFTAYVSDWIKENWALPDRRGEADSAPWDEGLEKYRSLVTPALLPFEWQPENRSDLPAAGFTAEPLPDGGVSVKWAPVPDADGYEVFRKKSASGEWERIAERTDTEEYVDNKGEAGFVYLVAAYRESESGRLYGTVDYAGIAAAG